MLVRRARFANAIGQHRNTVNDHLVRHVSESEPNERNVFVVYLERAAARVSETALIR